MTVAIRTIALVCLILAAPLVLLAAAWLPATCAAVSHYRDARLIPGTPSYHHDMKEQFVFSMVNAGVRAGALVAFVGYIVASLKPQSMLSVCIWLWSGAVASAHVVSFSLQHPPVNGSHVVPMSTLVLFWMIPSAIACLSLIATYVSILLRRRSAQVAA